MRSLSFQSKEKSRKSTNQTKKSVENEYNQKMKNYLTHIEKNYQKYEIKHPNSQSQCFSKPEKSENNFMKTFFNDMNFCKQKTCIAKCENPFKFQQLEYEEQSQKNQQHSRIVYFTHRDKNKKGQFLHMGRQKQDNHPINQQQNNFISNKNKIKSNSFINCTISGRKTQKCDESNRINNSNKKQKFINNNQDHYKSTNNSSVPKRLLFTYTSPTPSKQQFKINLANFQTYPIQKEIILHGRTTDNSTNSFSIVNCSGISQHQDLKQQIIKESSNIKQYNQLQRLQQIYLNHCKTPKPNDNEDSQFWPNRVQTETKQALDSGRTIMELLTQLDIHHESPFSQIPLRAIPNPQELSPSKSKDFINSSINPTSQFLKP